MLPDVDREITALSESLERERAKNLELIAKQRDMDLSVSSRSRVWVSSYSLVVIIAIVISINVFGVLEGSSYTAAIIAPSIFACAGGAGGAMFLYLLSTIRE